MDHDMSRQFSCWPVTLLAAFRASDLVLLSICSVTRVYLLRLFSNFTNSLESFVDPYLETVARFVRAGSIT